MSFPSDTSTQLNNALSISDNYTSATTPNINFNATSGIYNPSANVIKIYTNNIDALTINASQQLSGNGTGLTNLNYSAITNLPANFQTDWNTTVSNKPTNFQTDWNTTTVKCSTYNKGRTRMNCDESEFINQFGEKIYFNTYTGRAEAFKR